MIEKTEEKEMETGDLSHIPYSLPHPRKETADSREIISILPCIRN